MKKLVLLMALVCLVMVGVNKPADAALDWHPVTVYAAGCGAGLAWCGIKFTQGSGTQSYRMYFYNDGIGTQNQLLATAMTALANGGQAAAVIDPDTAYNGQWLWYLSADTTQPAP